MVSEFSFYASVIPYVWSKYWILFYKLNTDYQSSLESMTWAWIKARVSKCAFQRIRNHQGNDVTTIYIFQNLNLDLHCLGSNVMVSIGQDVAFLTTEGGNSGFIWRKKNFARYIRRDLTINFPFYWALRCPEMEGNRHFWRSEKILYNETLSLRMVRNCAVTKIYVSPFVTA